MKQSQNQTQTIQVLYELALSIGASLDLRQMLDVSMQAFAENLDCVVSTVYRCQTTGNSCQFEVVGTNTYEADKTDTRQMALAHLPTTSDEQQMAQFRATLPLVGNGADDDYYHLLDLPGFGFLLLIKDDAPLDEALIEALRPLQEKLAAAANACLPEENSPNTPGQFQTILESITTPLVISRLSDGKVIFANEPLANMMGYPLDELIGQVTPDFYYDSADRQTLLGLLRQQGILNDYEVRLKRNSGEPFWAWISIRIFDYEGEKALITTLLDITDRKQAEVALNQSEEKFRNLFEKSADAYLILEENIFTDCNQAAVEMLHATSKKEVLSLHPSKLSPEMQPDGRSSAEKADEMIKTAIEKGSHRFEWMHRRADGEDFPVEVLLTPIRLGNKEAVFTVWHDIVARKQAEATIAKRAAELETVARVSASTASILETDKLLQEVVDLTKERFDLYHAHVYLLNKAGDTLVLTAGAGEIGQKMVAEKRSIPVHQEQSLVAQAARTRKGIIENDVLNNPAFLPHPLLPKTRAEMAVPMLIGDRVIGVLDTQADRIGRFTQQDIIVKTTLAAQIAVALENARSFENAQTSLAETEALLDIAKESSRTLELKPILESVLDRVLVATKFEAGLISLEKPGTQTLELFSHRLPAPFLRTLQKHGLDNTLCDLVYRRQKSLVVVDLNDEAPVDVSGLIKLGFNSYQGVPIEAKGNVFGTICLFSTNLLDSNEANTVFLQAVSQQVGIAIQNANLLKQTQVALTEVEQSREVVQEYLDMQHVLHELNTELFQIDDLDELYRRAIELAHTRLGFERIGMFLLNESRDALLGTYGVDIDGNIHNEQGPEHIITIKETIDTFVLNRSRLIVEEDADLRQEGEVVGRGWHIGASMWAEETPIGVIFTDNLVTGQPLKPYQSELLFAYASTVASLIKRHRVEATIRERETLMRTIIDSTPDWIFVKDRDHRYQMVNKGYADAFQMTPQDFIGKNDLDIGFPEDIVKGDPEQGIQGFWPDDSEVMARGEMKIIDIEPAVVGEEDVFLSTIKTPLRDAEGNVTGIVGFVHDITNRIEVEESLRKSEAELSQTLEIAKLGYWEYDVEKDLFTFNDQLYAVYHTTAKQHGGYQLSSAYYAQHLVHPDDLAVVRDEIGLALSSTDRHYTRQLEHRIIYPDGKIGYVSVNVNVERDEHGNILRFYGANQDITDRKQAEEALKRSRADLSRAQRISALGSWKLDTKTLILSLGPEHLALMGLEEQHPEGWDINLMDYAAQFVVPTDVAVIQDRLEYGLAQQNNPTYTDDFEYRLKTIDGQIRDLRVHSRLFAPGVIFGITQDITERKQAEEKVRANEALLRTIIDSTPDWIFVKDREHRYQMVNKGYADSFNMMPEDFIGKDDLEIGFPEDIVKGNPEKGIQGFWPDDDEVMDSGERKIIDEEPAVVDGEARVLHTVKVPLHSTDDEVAGLVGFVQDITKQKATEEALQAAKEHTDTILRSITVPIVISRIKSGEIGYANGHLAQLVRMPLDELVGNATPNFYVRDEDRTAVVGAIQTEGSVNNYQLQLRRTDGEMFWALLSARLIEFEGAPAIITSLIDITDRKVAEEKVRANETLMRTIIDSTPDWIFVKDRNHRYQMVNQGYADAFQISSQDFLGKNDLEIGFPEDIVKGNPEKGIRGFWPDDDEIMESGQMKVIDIEPAVVDGEQRYLSTIKAPLKDADGQVTAVIGFVHDITDRIQTEEKLAKQANELADLTRRLTREGWQDYLSQTASKDIGYIFDSSEIEPIKPISQTANEAVHWVEDGNGSQPVKPLVQPISIHGEMIGQLAVLPEEDETEVNTEMAEIVQSVTEQLQARIENLRLTEQTQTALAETETLYDVSVHLNESRSYDDILDVLRRYTAGRNSHIVSLSLFDRPFTETQTPEWIDIPAYWAAESAAEKRETRHKFADYEWPAPGQIIHQPQVSITEEVTTEPNLDEKVRESYLQSNIQSTIILPLVVGEQWIGYINMLYPQTISFSDSEIELLNLLIRQIAVIVQSINLLQIARARALQEQTLRQITQRIRSSADVETIMRTAVQEIGRTLGRKTYIYLGEDHEA